MCAYAYAYYDDECDAAGGCDVTDGDIVIYAGDFDDDGHSSLHYDDDVAVVDCDTNDGNTTGYDTGNNVGNYDDGDVDGYDDDARYTSEGNAGDGADNDDDDDYDCDGGDDDVGD